MNRRFGGGVVYVRKRFVVFRRSKCWCLRGGIARVVKMDSAKASRTQQGRLEDGTKLRTRTECKRNYSLGLGEEGWEQICI